MHITKSLFMKYIPNSFPAVYSANTSRFTQEDVRVCARQLNKYFAIADSGNSAPPVHYVDNIELTVTTKRPTGADWLKAYSIDNWNYVRIGVGILSSEEIILDAARNWLRHNFPGHAALYVWVTVPNL